MKKFFMYSLVIIFTFGILSIAQAMSIQWDTYTDENASGLRIESSIDKITWNIIVDDILTSKIASEIPNGQSYTRIYYRIVAFNATDQSLPSNIVSFYWTEGGGGHEGLAPASNIQLLDCDLILEDTNHPDYSTCLEQNTIP
jgi:hypothetical protein